MRGRTWRWLALAAAAALAAGCGQKAPKGEAIARVNESVLTQQDFAEMFPAGAGGMSQLNKEEFLDEWVNTELFYQEAKRLKLNQDSKVARQIESLERGILARELFQREIVDKQKADEDEAKGYFDRHQAEYQVEIRLSQIVLPGPDEAASVIAALRQGEDFSRLAKLKSQDPATRDRGGDLGGYMRRGSPMVALEFEEKVFALARDSVSEPIKFPGGYRVMKVTDRRTAQQKVGFLEIRDELIQGLTRQKQNRALEEYAKGLRAKAKVESHPELLK